MSVEVTVKLFAAYQEAYNQPEIQLSFPEPVAVREVLARVLAEKPELEKWREVTRFGINLQFVPQDVLIDNGDEIVLIPPVSGG